MPDPYQPRDYWERRLSGTLDVSAVGHSGLGRFYNRWLYQGRFRALRRALRRHKLLVRGKSLLDVGVGSGAYIPFWQQAGVAGLAGLDITTVSVRHLSARFPQFEFAQADICALDLPTDRQWDIVTAFDVLFHVIDDAGFSTAIANLAKLTRPGGWVILSDGFCDNPLGPYYHEYHRTREHYVQELEAAGLHAVYFEPIFFTMTTTMCDPGGRNRRLAAFTHWMIGFLSRLAAHRSTAWANYLIGAALYAVDGVLGATQRSGPSLKLLFAQREL